MIADMGATSDTERLLWEDGIVRLEKGGRTIWRVYASQLAAVATCSAGLWRDSLCVAFVRADGVVFDAPLHAAGIAEAIAALGRALGAPIALTLPGTTRSRIAWPTVLDGQIAFQEAGSFGGLRDRVLRFVRLRSASEPALSDVLARHLAAGMALGPEGERGRQEAGA